MGVIRRQGMYSTIFSYFGAVVGFVNKVVIFGKFLSAEEMGLANVLLMASALLVPIGGLGLSNTILRYFPYFRTQKGHHHGIFFWIMVIPLVGILVVTGLYLVARPTLMGIWLQKSPLLADYEFYILPLFVFALYSSVLDAYTRSLYKTVVPVFLKQVLQRLLVTLAVVAYVLDWVNFDGFVFLYCVLFSSVTFFLLGYVVYLEEFSFRPQLGWRLKSMSKRLITFSLFSVLGSSSTTMSLYIDALMLTMFSSSSSDSSSMGDTGIYTTMVFVTALILIPWRALLKVTSPKVADYWKEGKLEDLGVLYKRTSLITLILGTFLFLGMWINRDFIVVLTDKPEFASGMFVMLILGLNRLVEMVSGLNGVILATSKHYRLDLVFTLGLLATVVGTNLIFIPRMGMDGAAIATFISFGGLNVLRSSYVWVVFKFHPLSWRMLWVLAIAALCYGINVFLIPSFSNAFVYFLVRSSVLVLAFWSLVIGFRVSKDLNDLVGMSLNKVKKMVGL